MAMRHGTVISIYILYDELGMTMRHGTVISISPYFNFDICIIILQKSSNC